MRQTNIKEIATMIIKGRGEASFDDFADDYEEEDYYDDDYEENDDEEEDYYDDCEEDSYDDESEDKDDNCISLYFRRRDDAGVVQEGEVEKKSESVGFYYVAKYNISPFDEFVMFGNDIDTKSISLNLENSDEEKIQKVIEGITEFLYGGNGNLELPEIFLPESDESWDDFEMYRDEFIFCKNCTLYKEGKCCLTKEKKGKLPENFCKDFHEKFSDEELELLWLKFGDVPMNPETEEIEEDFFIWEAGTFREDIWHWFDERYSEGVGELMHKNLWDKFMKR